MKNVSKMCLWWNSIASCRKCCQTFSNLSWWNFNCILFKYFETFSTCVLAEIQLHPIEIIFKLFQFVCSRKIICVVPNLMWDTLKLYQDKNPVALYRNYSKTSLNCLLTKFQLQCTKNIEKPFQNVSWAKLICTLLKFF